MIDSTPDTHAQYYELYRKYKAKYISLKRRRARSSNIIEQMGGGTTIRKVSSNKDGDLGVKFTIRGEGQIFWKLRDFESKSGERLSDTDIVEGDKIDITTKPLGDAVLIPDYVVHNENVYHMSINNH